MGDRINHLYRLLKRHWLWGIRALVAYLALGALVPALPRAPLQQPDQVVETVKPHVCLHTRLIDEVEEWKIQRSLQLVREMGAGTVDDVSTVPTIVGMAAEYSP